MSFPDDPTTAELRPDNPRGLALALQAAIDAGHARRAELESARAEEKNRRIRVIFDTLTGANGARDERYLFGRITAAIAEGATSIQIPCGNASPEEMAAALRMIPGIRLGPFNTTHASALQVAWSESDAQAVLSAEAVDPSPVQAIQVGQFRAHDDDGRAAFNIAADHAMRSRY